MDILKLTVSQLVYKNGKLSQSQKIAEETHLGNSIDTDTILEKLLVSRREIQTKMTGNDRDAKNKTRILQDLVRAAPNLEEAPWRLRW